MRRYKKKLEFMMTVLILAGSFYIGRYTAAVADGRRQEEAVRRRQEEVAVSAQTGGADDERVSGTDQSVRRVVIDAGHGGFDSGKVGINNALEKEVNLAVAQKLKVLLETEGVDVLMTRETDDGLYDEGEENKKQQDMKRRCTMINESGAAIAVSIHQNSYTEESVHGPQVFYYETSVQAKELASVLQDALNSGLQVGRAREIKANDSYYLLRKTAVPTVIVECGFLSNYEEAANLVTEDYQQKVAQAVCNGVMQYLDAV